MLRKDVPRQEPSVDVCHSADGRRDGTSNGEFSRGYGEKGWYPGGWSSARIKTNALLQPRWTDEPPERVQWEWRRVKRSLAAKRRDKLTQELRYWNEDLRNCLEKAEVPAEDDNRNVQKVKLRYNGKSCDALRDTLRSLQRAIEFAMRCDSCLSHGATIELDWVTAKLNYPQTLSVALSHDDHSNVTKTSIVDGIWKRINITVAENKAIDTQNLLLAPSSPKPPRSPSPSGSVRFKLAHLRSSSRKWNSPEPQLGM